MTELTMRERLARAICRHEISGAVWPDDLDSSVHQEWRGFRGHADAVLAEMETPTEAMIKATSSYRIEEASTGWECDPGDVWRAMIAEARKA